MGSKDNILHNDHGQFAYSECLRGVNSDASCDYNEFKRQITPLSPRWRYAIERRVEDERQLTIRAVGDGARLKPGRFWDLPGTFLFAVYVMTALGFGAPVPHTLLGRTSALLYAILAIPTHIYLMVNASTCMIVHVEAYTKNLKDNFCGKFSEHKHDFVNKRENVNCSRDSEITKSSTKWYLCRKIIRCFGIIGAGRCVPLATIAYYIIGVVAFGILRNKTPLETAMFPLEFTTTGGLEHVEGYVRIFYGFYVEGAMCLLACVLAIVRRHGSSIFSSISEPCRLFERDTCEQCSSDKERV
nr:uncharacterized protein LOC113391494 [Vanessa tameamea]